MKAFQTGRYYGQQGQRIAYTVLPNGMTAFNDIDRGIDGCFYLGDTPTDSEVLNAYDKGGYSHTADRFGVEFDRRHLRSIMHDLKQVALTAPVLTD